MLKKHRRLLVLALILFLTAGGADIYVIYTQVMPRLLEGETATSDHIAAVPPSKEAAPVGVGEVMAAPTPPPRVQIPVREETDVDAAPPTSTDAETERSGESTASTAGDDTGSGPDDATASPLAPESPPTQTPPAVTKLRRAKQRSLPGVEILRFGPNKDLLWKFEKQILRDVAKHVKRYANVDVLIVGHADSAEKDPMAISQARADMAKSFLVSEGVTPDKIETEAKGDSKPVTTATAEEERKRNRRVRVHLIAKEE